MPYLDVDLMDENPSSRIPIMMGGGGEGVHMKTV